MAVVAGSRVSHSQKRSSQASQPAQSIEKEEHEPSRNQGDDLGSTDSPQSQKSQQSSLADLEAEHNAEYARRLQEIPGFEPYDDGASVIPTFSLTRYGRNGYRSDASKLSRENATPLDHPKYPDLHSDLVKNADTELLAQLLPILEDIAKRREKLLQTQTQVEDTERQLAHDRSDITEEVQKAGFVAQSDDKSVDYIRSKWQKSLARLQSTLRRMADAEEVLQSKQQEMTQIQADFEHAINRLYGMFTAGARLSDTSSMSHGFATQKAKQNAEDVSYFNGPVVSSGDDLAALLDPWRHGVDLESEDGGKSTLWGTTVAQNRTQAPSVEKERLPPNPANRPIPSQAVTVPKKRIRRNPLDLASIGKQFRPFHEAERNAAIDAAIPESLIFAPASLKDVRRKDLEPELNLGVYRYRNNSVSSAKTQRFMLRRGHIDKFDNLMGSKSAHRLDLITSWGSSMSQNSWSDLRRLALYDEPETERLPLFDLLSSVDATAFTKFLRDWDIPSLQAPGREEAVALKRKSPAVKRPIAQSEGSLQVHPSDMQHARSFLDANQETEASHLSLPRAHSPTAGSEAISGASSEHNHPTIADKDHLQAMEEREKNQSLEGHE